MFFEEGLIWDFDDDEVQDDEWTNAELRDSFATSCLIRCRKISSTTYFTKGKLNELGMYIKDNQAINTVFINSTLTAT